MIAHASGPEAVDPSVRSIAVIVPAYNAAAYIERCLKGLLSAGFALSEIAVVDDGSRDDTVALVMAQGITPIVQAKNAGAAAARNAAVRATSADILFFVDADVVVHADVRARIIGFFTDQPGYAALFGSYDDAPAVATVVSRFRNLLHHFVHHMARGDAVTFWTGCGAVRRSAFDQAGGFDPGQRMMEDVQLGLKLHRDGHRIRLDPDIQGTHLKAWTLGSMCRTDLFDRAIPWTRLLRTPLGKASGTALNLNATGQLSGVLVAMTLLSPLFLAISPGGAIGLCALSIAGLCALNRRFLALMNARFGAAAALAAIPLLWLHYLCGGLGFAWGHLRG
jgi:hypothetical protein